MIISRRLRRWVSGGMMVALLFMQLATAAYACPQLALDLSEAEHAASAEAAMSASMSAAMPDCHAMPADSMDSDQPTLCKAHCNKDAQSTAAQAAPDLQANPAANALLLRIVEPTPVAEEAQLSAVNPPWRLPPRGSPPLYLSLLVLRN